MTNLKALTENKPLVRKLLIAGLIALGLGQYLTQNQSSSIKNANHDVCCAFPDKIQGTQPQQFQDQGYDQQSQQYVNPYTSSDSSSYGTGSGDSGYNALNADSSFSANTQNSGGEIAQPYNQLNDPDYIKSRENIQQQQRDLLGDTTTFVDSSTGEQVQVDQSATNAWADNSGNVVSSDTSATNPGPSYTELQPLQTDTGTSTDTSAGQ